MKRKFLVFICVMLLAVLCLTACVQADEEAALRKDGYNIVVTFDCGKYANRAVTTDEDAEQIQYGEVHVDNVKDFVIGQIGIENYSVRSFYFNQENICIFEPGKINQVVAASLQDRVFAGWYLASVVEYKLDENGQPIKNVYGQYEYGKVVPQDTDILWDFATPIGTYENHPYVVTKYVYDGTKAFDAQVTVNGQTVTNGSVYTDEQLGYGKDNGFNVYLYAKWNVQPKFVVSADVNGDGTWEEILRTTPQSGKYTPDTYKLNNQKGYTYYNMYTDKEFTTLWDSSKTFDSVFTGGADSLRPYVKLYAKYIEGDWTIVRTEAQLSSALWGNKNVYLDADLEIKNWATITSYSGEIKGNNHTLTFVNEIANPDRRTENNYGLFGEFKGKMSDITFNNVVINYKNYVLVSGAVNCGVLVGKVAEGATFANVTVNGKIIYSESVAKNANQEGGIVVYVGGEADIATSNWYGMATGTLTGVTYVNTTDVE